MDYTTFTEVIEKNYGKNPMFLKVIKDDNTHHNFTYKLGVNKDMLQFNPSGSCEAGGLYFSVNEHIIKYLEYGEKIAVIKLAEDAIFYMEQNGDKFKTNKLIIENMYTFEEFFTKNQELCKLAVQQNGYALQYVKDKTEELCKLAVQQNGLALVYIQNQTEKICKLAMQQNFNAVQYVKIKQKNYVN